MSKWMTLTLLVPILLFAAGRPQPALASSRIQPIYSVMQHPVPNALKGQLMLEQLDVAIAQAASSKGWALDRIAPGHAQATLRWQSHAAVVDINYTVDSYSITLASSTNLKQGNGNIHRKYNEGVRALEDEIERLLRLLSVRKP